MSCTPLARLMFIGLWNFCDDSGVHPLKPVSLKALIFPGDAFDSTSIRRLLDDLSQNDLIALYESGGKEYLQVLGWDHQRIDKPTRKYPTMESGNPIKTVACSKKFEESSNSARRPIVEGSATEGIGDKDQDQDQKLSVKKPKKPAFDQQWFDTFWKLYPNKVAKPKAKAEFEKQCKDESAFDRIMAGLKQHVLSELFVKDEGRFIPHPTTWLNQERYNDEVKPYVAGFNAGTGSTQRPSLVDRVRQANAQHLADEQPPEFHDEREWPEFDSLREVNGSIVGADD